MNSFEMLGVKPLWQNGIASGAPYSFLNNVSVPMSSDFNQRSRAPVTTSSSLVALKFNEGVIMAGDLLASYGSLARFRNCPRIMKVNEHIILGAGGDYADYQYLKEIIEQKIINEECLDDGFKLRPKSMYCWLTRIMYNRRSKFDPLWNNLVIGGFENDSVFLGTVDKLGTAYEDNVICTGYGAYMALPLLRSATEKNPNQNLDEARQLVDNCMEVLLYRDARTSSKYQVAVITKDGVQIDGPIEAKQNWHLATM